MHQRTAPHAADDPAPKAPFCIDRCLIQSPRNGIFHIYDYTIGFVGGRGAHPADMLQWWLDHSGLPNMPVSCDAKGVIPTAGLFNTLTHWDGQLIYPNGLKLRFMDHETANKEKPHPGVEADHGTLFVGSEGWVRVSRGDWKTSGNELREKARVPSACLIAATRSKTLSIVS